MAEATSPASSKKDIVPPLSVRIPEITIPSEWYHWFLTGGEKPSEPTSLVDEWCDVCGWNGQDDTLFRHQYYQVEIATLKHQTCISCQCLLHASKEIIGHISEQDKPDQREATRYHCWNMQVTSLSPRLHPLQATFLLEEDGARLSSFLFFPSNGNMPSNPWSLPTRNVVTSGVLSEESALWAKERLRECSKDHLDCITHTLESEFLPTRLIAVQPLGPNGDVRLVPTSTLAVRDVRYAAVSYVWSDGKLQAQSKTTRDNIGQRMERISWTEIPRTLQDTITFTRNIGLDYVWIDSFCILQNDQEEWSYEASRMFDVYKQSFVLLGVLWGSDCSKGLSSSPDTYYTKHIATLRLGQYTWPLHVGREHEVLDLKYFWQSQRPPLFKRAWCFQERSIPSTCIFFGRNELIFGCYHHVTCQCGIGYEDANDSLQTEEKVKATNECQMDEIVMEEEAKTDNQNKNTLEIEDGGTKEDTHGLRWIEENPEQAWVEILEEYTRLQLTHENERLIAVGGVAKQLSFARPGEQYLAGLWSGSFIRDLLWRVPRYHYGEDNPGVPSWSWAHHSNPVQYGRYGEITPTAEVVEVACSYHNDNAFGMLKDSKLIMRGRLMHWWSSASKVLSRIPWVRTHRAFSWDHHLIANPPNFSVISDDCHWERVPEDCYVFEVGYAQQNEDVRFFLLLKLENSQLQTFSRIGVLQDWLVMEVDEYVVSPDMKALNSIFSKKSKFTSISLI